MSRERTVWRRERPLAREHSAIGGVVFIAAEVEFSVGVFEDFDAAADAAIGAGGFEELCGGEGHG